MDLLTETRQENKFLTISIAYLGSKFIGELDKTLHKDIDIIQFDKLEVLAGYLKKQSLLSIPDILLLEIEDNIGPLFSFVSELRNSSANKGISIILLAFKNNKEAILKTFFSRVNDIYFYPFNVVNIQERLRFIVKFKLLDDKSRTITTNKVHEEYRMPLSKRLFDILVAGSLLLAACPIMILVAILIKLDSPGPVFYVSKRAGSGYKVFNFFKFRSMRVDADKKLAELASLNQYANNGSPTAFVKIKDDPRVTKLGSFLRNTSLDELPQLLNVLKGDMSLVGNRPLPLYEAQMLTSDEWSMRFLGPAGITGLWQVTKRGKSDMSDEERRKLDNYYVNNFSFWMDFKVFMKTIPALIQKEKV
ncbi:sugar transferase [Parapedobacter indicus]|uniref:Sugar transferase involved in LPS biosynthesis (Colanic, teichoic acid) n=1 Tax=Parapedobacter indicus TaxID=1477437 RepID=A0A1I3QX97_9SPHI|nr:sugar transferase [Parapedobacter indicus]PPL00270.1 lipopolysaccharide/colanic/teichoic acid biosynthesis glycosyltransferase [Parapedobacter indicus]SFJ38360.1 Sugar transferase involved in LPS biosynthesis (colanic, teichoic acid) [Parapedobacter indicus]